jgi:hypothetical protein
MSTTLNKAATDFLKARHLSPDKQPTRDVQNKENELGPPFTNKALFNATF